MSMKTILHICKNSKIYLISFLLLLCSNALAVDGQYDVIISRSSQELKIMDGEQIVKQFHVAYGKGGKGAKRVLGDEKTPLGVYKIIKFKGDSQFHYFMHLDYPNLLDAWYGYKNKVITATEFKNITTAIKNNNIPPQNTKLGGYIGIHGLGDTTDQKLAIHNEINWTQGCIAMTNDEINDLKKYVGIGTRVIINE
jgi:murein L,D-transpeptidase YafK